MAKPSIASKIKNLARDLKEENKEGVKKIGDAVRAAQTRKKESTEGGKLSGRKVSD